MTKDKNNTAGNNSLFGKQNYLLMLAGLAVLALGFF